MINRKILYGLSAGAAGYALYRYMKGKINPLILRNLESAFASGDNLLELGNSLYGKGINTAKSLFNQNSTYFNHTQNEVLKDIQELKHQISYMEEKISNLKTDM